MNVRKLPVLFGSNGDVESPDTATATTIDTNENTAYSAIAKEEITPAIEETISKANCIEYDNLQITLGGSKNPVAAETIMPEENIAYNAHEMKAGTEDCASYLNQAKAKGNENTRSPIYQTEYEDSFLSQSSRHPRPVQISAEEINNPISDFDTDMNIAYNAQEIPN